VAEWRATRPGAQDALEVHLRRLNGLPGNAPSLRELDALIDRQHYRLVRWKAGVHEINYRRFFAIASLVGLRMENPAVFRETHRLLETLLKAGRVTGLRIDHIDGLREPEDYLRRLQGLARPAPDRPLYVVVEKILAPPDETLPDSLAVQGTTGYEFIFQVAGLLVDPAAEARITATYRRFTGESATYQEAVYAAKRLVLTELFADAVSKLGAELAELVARDWQWQDMTRHELIVAVRELMAGLPVYRTYRESTATAGATDRAVLAEACRRAVERNSRLDPQPFEFLRSLLAGDYPRASAPADYKKRLAEWVLTFQPYTGAVMAKAVEDTAFYTSSMKTGRVSLMQPRRDRRLP